MEQCSAGGKPILKARSLASGKFNKSDLDNMLEENQAVSNPGKWLLLFEREDSGAQDLIECDTFLLLSRLKSLLKFIVLECAVQADTKGNKLVLV